MEREDIRLEQFNEGLLRAYVNIVFDNCLMIRESRVIQGPTGLLSRCLPRSRETARTGSLRVRLMLKPET
jgi:DNA-binding cell septation regulator SpoVG